MALSRERIADELIKLLAVDDPAPTVATMIEHAILGPVLPEVGRDGLERLTGVVAAERQAEIDADPLRRLAALLPPDPPLAERLAARLKLSNKARKRLACSAERHLGSSPQALAYRVGVECAIDRLLIAGKAEAAMALRGWRVPRMPIGGGTLIERGLAPGPVVARTLRLIEDRWVDAGFPTGPAFDRLVDDAVGPGGQ